MTLPADQIDRIPEKLRQHGATHSLAEGTELLRQGEDADRVCIVLKGMVKLVETEPDGREAIVELCSSGDIVGWSGIGMINPLSAIACGVFQGAKCMVHVITIRDLQHLKEDREVLEFLHQGQMALLARLARRVTQLAVQSCEERLITFLMELPTQPICGEEGRGWVKLPLKDYELASFLGVSATHFCRLLNRLERRSAIVRRDGWMRLEGPGSA